MQKEMNYRDREDYATRIGMFLVSKDQKVWGEWQGRLSKQEQLEAFGFYMGKGLITVDGEHNNISMRIKVCFGQDFEDVCGISANSGHAWDNRGKSQFRTQFQYLIN